MKPILSRETYKNLYICTLEELDEAQARIAFLEELVREHLGDIEDLQTLQEAKQRMYKHKCNVLETKLKELRNKNG